MDVLVSPLEVVDYPFVSKFLFDYKKILEKLHNPLINIEVVKLRNHCLLILEVLLISVNQCIPLINDTSQVLKHLCVELLLQTRQRVINSLVFSFLSLKFIVHCFDLVIVPFKFT